MIKLSFLFFLISVNSISSIAQIIYKVEGNIINNTEMGIWPGVNIPRNVPTKLIYRNNSITSANSEGYLLQAGDENPDKTNNNLDAQEITGNNFSWKGPIDPKIITHGLFTGYNINSVIKYNHLVNVPYGIIFKSGTDEGKNMTFTSGGCAYNICKNGKFSVRMKGINGVKVYNNTFYNGDGSGWYLVMITSNQDRIIPPPSRGTKIFNNIFYSTTKIPMISTETSCLLNFESDYNIFWCTAGEPTFAIDGRKYTWHQWQNLGYDVHSKLINPNFINTNELVPKERLDFGKDLGPEWETGLSTTASWVAGSSPETTNQNGKWQVGARIWQINENFKDSTSLYKIYPNPNDGNIKIQINQIPSDGVFVEIRNSLGQILIKKKIFNNITEWPISQYSGSVFITLKSNNIHATERILMANPVN